ncbi:MAG: aminoacylase [bacterium]|nr:aminoacylase [bacterium]
MSGKNVQIVLFVVAILLAGIVPAGAQDYDIVIMGGRVMDPERMFDAVRNVGVRDGRIAVITEAAITGRETVDATGLVVAPGFIDTHVHSSNKFNIKMVMMDGVTSAMDFEAGALNVGQWYDREAGRWPTNFGTCTSHEMARMKVHDGLDISGPVDASDMIDMRAESLAADGIPGWSVTVSNLDQINQITQLLDEDLRQGALCVGNTVGYASKGISTYEMFEAQRAGARYGRATALHSRFHTSSKPPNEAQLGFAEVFTNAVLLKAPLLYMHNNDYGWWEIEEKLQMAREMDLNMWSEYYPYAAGSSAIGADGYKPEAVEGMLGLKYEDMMYDPAQDKYLTKEEYLQIVEVDPSRIVVGFNPPRLEWMKHWLRMPHMVVAADSMWSTDTSQNWDTDPAEYVGHPRTSGTHTKSLRMAREGGVPLMFTLAQLSYWSARHLGDTGIEAMKVRGRMQEGMVADITIFDSETVAEGSDYKPGMNGLPPRGLPHVIVNGRFVKRDGQATDVMAGQPIRFPVEENGRYVPASTEQWLNDFSLVDSGAVRPRPE